MSRQRFITEFDVRRIGADGECYDVDSFAKRADAIQDAQDAIARGTAAAVVVEKHRFCIEREDVRDSEYTTIITLGDANAIRRWHGEDC